MIEVHDLEDHQAKEAIRNGEFGNDVLGSSTNVAVVLSQDWCHQWLDMDRWLGELKGDRVEGLDITVFTLLYIRKDYFRTFLDYKENRLKNRLVPYVRYYVDGQLISQTNYVSKERFLEIFRNG